VDGNQSNGKVLTSDANGVATWQTASGGSLPAGTSGQTLRHNGTTWVANSTIFNNGTNVGIGTSTPNAPLQFANTTANRKIVLYDNGSGNQHQFTGLGINDAVFRYQADATTTDHVFYAGTSTSTSNELMRIKGTGLVGIGTASPTTNLHVAGTFRLVDGNQSNGKVLTSDANGVATWQTASGGSLPAGTSGQTLRHNGTTWVANSNIFNDGTNLGIGTSSPSSKLHIQTPDPATNFALLDFRNGSGYGIYALSSSSPGRGNTLDFLATDYKTDGSPVTTRNVLTLRPEGRVGIGTASPSEVLHVVGNICATGTIATCSDLRYKKDIFKIDNALSLISKFNGYTYNFKVKEFPDHKFDSTAQVGFIAQELQKVLPQVVQKNESGYLSVDYAKVTPLLLMAIKEQQAEIAIQKSEIETLKAQASNSTQKLTDLENKVNALLLLLNNKEELTVKQD
jgi:hypothetical protein